MEVISVKLDSVMLKEIDDSLASHRYSTRTEFIRDAIRQKLSDLEKEDLIRHISALKGFSKRKTNDKDLHSVREEIFGLLEKKSK